MYQYVKWKEKDPMNADDRISGMETPKIFLWGNLTYVFYIVLSIH